jgi:hypothetical protein
MGFLSIKVTVLYLTLSATNRKAHEKIESSYANRIAVVYAIPMGPNK